MMVQPIWAALFLIFSPNEPWYPAVDHLEPALATTDTTINSAR